MGFTSVQELTGDDAARRSDRTLKGWETRRANRREREAAERMFWEKTGVSLISFCEWLVKQPPCIARLDTEILVARFMATI